MNKPSEKEDDWQAKATAAAIAGARKIAVSFGPLMNTPVGALKDEQWGWLVTAAIFGWVRVKVEQAIAENRDSEAMVRMTGLNPDPCDVAVVHSILPKLVDQAGIDWSLPLTAWTKDAMTSFLLVAWRLIGEAETTRDHGPGRILEQAPF